MGFVQRPNVVEILEERALLESITSENLSSACSNPSLSPLKLRGGNDMCPTKFGAQRRLAEEVTRFVHGEEDLSEAETRLDWKNIEGIAEDVASSSLAYDQFRITSSETTSNSGVCSLDQRAYSYTSEMTTKMKGLLKGLRYISQIFDNGNDKEQEMQIGYPTDVKHVAHIGWDGPSVSSPSWMNEFRSTPEYSSAPLSLGGETKQDPKPKRTYEDPNRNGQDSPARDMPELPKPRRRTSSGTASSFDAVTQELPDAPKQARRHHQSTDGSINSPTRDPTDRIKPRRKTNSTPTMDPTLQELPSVPKQSRKKKSKNGSSSGGSTRLRSKGHPSTTYTSPFSDPGSGSGSKKSEPSLTSALKALDLEEKGGDQRVL